MIYKFTSMSPKIQAGFFVNIDKWLLKFVWKCTGPRLVKTILKRKRRFTFTNFKLYYKSRVTKTT